MFCVYAIQPAYQMCFHHDQRFLSLQIGSVPFLSKLTGFKVSSTSAYQKGQQLVDDLKEKYETSDHPVVHKVRWNERRMSRDLKERLIYIYLIIIHCPVRLFEIFCILTGWGVQGTHVCWFRGQQSHARDSHSWPQFRHEHFPKIYQGESMCSCIQLDN